MARRLYAQQHVGKPVLLLDGFSPRQQVQQAVFIVLKQAATTELDTSVIEGASNMLVLCNVGSNDQRRFRNSRNPLILLARWVMLHLERPPFIRAVNVRNIRDPAYRRRSFLSNLKLIHYRNGSFDKDTLKVPVYQKDDALDVPVCYCFGWTRERLIQAVQKNEHPIDHIRQHVQANRCGCEVNNPQGSCCLGNVTAYVRTISKG